MPNITYHVLWYVSEYLIARHGDLRIFDLELQSLKLGVKGIDRIIDSLTAHEVTKMQSKIDYIEEEYEEEVDDTIDTIVTEIVNEPAPDSIQALPPPPSYDDQLIELSLEDEGPVDGIRFTRIEE